MGIFFSIRYKFLAVMTGLLLFCVGLYLFLATRIFIEDKTELIFDYNRNVVTNLSSELEDLFKRVSDKMKMAAHFYREDNPNSKKIISEIIEKSSELAFVGGSDDFLKIESVFHSDQDFLETYGLKEEIFQDGTVGRSVPFEKIKKNGEAIWSVSAGEEGAPLIGYGKSVIETDGTGQAINQFAVVAFIRPDYLIEEMAQTKLNKVLVTDLKGEVLLSDTGRMEPVPEELLSLVKKASEFPFSTHVLQYELAGKKYIGAFSKGKDAQFVAISNVPYNKAFAAIDRLVYRSIILSSILFTLSVLGAILLSRSITRPIDELVKGMGSVRDGDLGTRIAVESNDEIAVLASSFNSMIRDLSESREELTEANRHLEEKVRDRTLELEHQNQAVKEAQEALLRTTRLASIGEVAGQAAHEVLNPLTSIMARAQRIKRDLKAELSERDGVVGEIVSAWKKDHREGGFIKLVKVWEGPSEIEKGSTLFEEDMNNIELVLSTREKNQKALVDDVNFLLGESQRINRIVNSMRSMSVINSDVRVCSVSEMLERSVSIMADLAEKYHVSLKVSSQTNYDNCLLDEDEFIQSVTNLLRNAIQAIPADQEGGCVDIQTFNDENGIVIDIADNGVGISDENKKRVFLTQFSTKPKDQGTGLGLSITRRFLRAFDGDVILLRSEIGEGTVFRITLPVVEVDSEEESA